MDQSKKEDVSHHSLGGCVCVYMCVCTLVPDLKHSYFFKLKKKKMI